MNQIKYKPDWNNSISPYLMVENVEAEIKFIIDVFGGELVEAPKPPDGRVFHAEIKIEDSVIMIGKSSKEWPNLIGNIHMYIVDLDAAYERAIRLSANSIAAPEDKFYGNREAGFIDIQGNQWWLAKLIKPMTEDEITDKHPGKI